MSGKLHNFPKVAQLSVMDLGDKPPSHPHCKVGFSLPSHAMSYRGKSRLS